MNLFEAAVASRSQVIVQDGNDQVTISEDDSPLPTPLQETEKQLQTQSTPIKQSKTVTHSVDLYSPPRVGDLLLSSVLVLSGLTTVYQLPSTLSSVLIMHLSPMLLVSPIQLSSKIVPQRLRWLLSTSSIYFSIAVFSLVIRFKAHGEVWLQYDKVIPTFFSHPAQSSISADNLCVALTVIIGLYDEGKKSNYLFILLTPILGPSVIMAFKASMESRRLEQLQEKRYQTIKTKSKELQGQDVLIKTRMTSTTYRKSIRTQSEDWSGPEGA